jgi:pimeloyl-ACP methyl ester carboxylesterase
MKIPVILFIIVFASLHSAAQQDKLKTLRCPCSKLGLDSLWAKGNNVTCFTIPVNKDKAQPALGTYSIAVAIAKSDVRSLQPPVLYLHGGPGIATLDNLTRYLTLPAWKLLRKQHDLIFMDYRGTGASEPELCNYLQDSLYTFATTNPSATTFKAKELLLYTDCLQALEKRGIALSTFSSLQLASDADEIRKALHISSWNIYGVSFGTTVALNILRNFASGVKSVILDSPFPPNAPWNDFVRPFATSFEVLEKKILIDSVTAKLFTNLRKDFVSAVQRLNQTPTKLSFKRGNNIVIHNYSGDDFAWSIWNALLKPKAIPFVPMAIREIGSGNDAILQQWSDAFSGSDTYGKFSETQSRAILCFEGRPQKDQDTEESLLRNYPDFASFNSGYNTSICDVWRPDHADQSIFAPVVSALPVLILSGEYDPVCPPLFGELTARTLSNATFIVVPAASHAVIQADACIRAIAANFFINPLTKPKTQCVQKRSDIRFVVNDFSAMLKAEKSEK